MHVIRRKAPSVSRTAQAWRPDAFALVVASAFACPLPVHSQVALPTNGVVVNGAASIQQSGKTLTVTNTPGTVINWQSFSIGQGATTQFIQQSPASAVFNRVMAGNPSTIDGSLLSNGRVFLINPSGITIGGGAMVDTAGFVASSLGISSSDLLAGKFKFAATPGAANVVNHGTIVTQSGGFVYFIGKNVENHGVIHTPRGEIILAAGDSVEIINPRTPSLRVEITATQNEAVNLGKLVASGGTIGMYAGSIRQGGAVSASSAEVNAHGKIVLRARRGIELAAGSRTEASGPGGGTVVVQSETGTVTVAGSIEARGDAAPRVESGLAVANPAIAAFNTINVAAALPGLANGQRATARGIEAVRVSARATRAVDLITPPAPDESAPLQGGTVAVLGDGVALVGNARIDVSGEQGGGTLLVGGDFQGKNAQVQNARLTWVGRDAMLNADARLRGDGGKVIVWADVATHFTGSISARGGALGGNGGFAEV